MNDVLKSGSGWVLETATAINSQGVIVGTGTLNGVQEGYLLYTTNGLVITTQPSPTATAGVGFSTQPVVEEQDNNGDLEIWDNTSVVTAIDSIRPPLEGNTNVTLVGGVAAYTNLSEETAATITLTFYSGSDTVGPSRSIVVSPAAAMQIAFKSSPLSQTAGTMGNIVVGLEDQYGNSGAVSTSAQTIDLSTTSGSGAFYATENSTSPITSVSIPAGQTSVSFYYEDTLAGTPTVTAFDSAFNSTNGTRTQDETINPAPAVQVGITSSPLTQNSGSKGQISFELEDQYGNASPVSANQTIDLAATNGGVFYASSSGGSPITQLVIDEGQASASVYFLDNTAGTSTVTLTDTSFTSAAPIQQETVDALPASQLGITTLPLLLSAGSEGEITLQLEDPYGNPTTSSSMQSITLASTSPAGVFYATSSSTSPISSATIPVGQSSISVYYFDTKAGTPTVSASDSALSPTPTQQETVTPLATSQVAITSPAIDQVVDAFGLFTVELEDKYGNASPSSSGQTIDLSTSSTSGGFYASQSLNTPVSTIVISSGQTTASVYYEDGQPGQPTLTATDTALGSSPMQQATINSIAASQVAITSAPLTLTAGDRGAITISLLDAEGDPSTSTSAQTIDLSTTSAGGAFFASQTGTTAITNITIPVGTTGETIYYSDTAAGTPTVKASDTAFESAPTQVETVNSAPASQVVFSTAALSLAAGSRGQITLMLEDPYGNPASAAAAQTIKLTSTSTAGEFFLTQSSTSTVSSISIAAGQTTGSVYYADTKAGSPVVTATDTAFNSPAPTQTESVSALAASQVAFTSTALNLVAGALGEFTVELQDTYGNPAVSSSAQTLAFSSTSTGGAFYASASGNQSIASIVVPIGQSAGSAYYTDTKAGTPTLTVDDVALASRPVQNETITAGPAAKVTIDSPALAISAGSMGGMTAELVDQYGNPTTSSSSQTINLATTSTAGTFYTGQSGAPPTTTVVIVAGQTSVSFFYSDTKAGTPSVTVSDTNISLGDTQQETINALAASQVVFASAPLALTAGSGGQITFELADPYGNQGAISTSAQTINLQTTTTTGSFYASSSSTVPITSVSIAMGQSSKSVYYSDTKAGKPTVTASDTALNSAPTQEESVAAAPASQVVLTSSALSLLAGNRGQITFQLEDPFANPATSTRRKWSH